MCIFTSPLSSPTLNAHPTSYIPHPLLYRALTLVPLQAVTPSHCTIVALSLYLTPLCCPVAHRFVPSHCDAALLEPLRLVWVSILVFVSFAINFFLYMTLSKKVVDMSELWSLVCQGVPDATGICSTLWKLLLGYLLPNCGLWSTELAKKLAITVQ
ncbi:hypothetical protein GmHk_19G054650 [Glycine max]|nr:hypothetical protein GmHk_19G054650 [Glycine max]